MSLWSHQERAIEWGLARRNVILNYGMGSGKSRCAVEMVRQADGDTAKVLICCPKAVLPAWKKQFALWFPDCRVVLLEKGTAKQKEAQLTAAMAFSGPLAIVVNYETAWRMPTLEKYRWTTIVYDEIHRLKSAGGKASRWAARMGGKNPNCRRVGLSGTLLAHSILDAYGAWRAIESPECPTFGSNFAAFRARYSLSHPTMPGMILKWIRQDEFAQKVAATTLYCKTTDVLDLPEIMHHQIDVTLTPKEAKLYRDLESDLCAACDDGTVTPANALVHLLRLQQITGGWVKPDEQPARQIDETPSKASAIADLIADLPANEPVVIFCRFKSDIKSCKAICADRGVSELSGDANELADWQAGKTNVLVAQIQSGGIGIDLTRAAYCIFASLGYSLAEYEQALARLHRPGQERTTHFYHVVAENTVDQDVYAALRERKEVIESVLNKYTLGQTNERTCGVGTDR